MLSTFTVANLNDSGPNSLRQAILGADASTDPGVQVIDFQVAGVVTLSSGPLPAITRPVFLDGASAPGFSQAQRPVVELDDNGYAGLQLNAGSSGSTIRGLAIDDSGSNGITLSAGNITVVGNFIGLRLDGATPGPNAGNGIAINPTSTNDTIGAASSVASGTVISTASNVISNNDQSGIAVLGSSGNSIVANYIGTDVTGLLPRGNGQNGILLDNDANQNTIGGAIAFGTPGLVPASNLVSANAADGIRIDNDSSFNILAGNFVGTDVTGKAALGNLADGVVIASGSDSNVLLGTTANQSPFIYANIVGGNLGNGLVISNADNTGVFANHFGLGVDNTTPVGNGLDGALIEGTSTGTLFGGLIPLGNVCASNGGNGLEIRDLASNTLVSNTFCGVAAFSPQSNLGNGLDGMRITSSGGGISIHTGNIIARNRLNGVEIGGIATGVQLYADLIGTNTDGTIPMPNGEDGVRIDGLAHNNAIGSPAVGPTSDSKVTNAMNATRMIIAANAGNGVSVLDSAYDNQIINSYIGTASQGGKALPNGGSGVYLGGTSIATTVGGAANPLGNLISGNLVNGITINGSSANLIQGNSIGTNPAGTGPLPNGGSGVLISFSSNNLVGGTTPGAPNTIAFNGFSGVVVNSGSGNGIRRNAIFGNRGKGIDIEPGANRNQPAPTLTHTKAEAKRLGIGGNLKAKPKSTYQVELFSSPVGQTSTSSGQTYLATDTVITNSQGFARFRFYLEPGAVGDVFFTTTATDASNDTSGFSNALVATPKPAAVKLR